MMTIMHLPCDAQKADHEAMSIDGVRDLGGGLYTCDP